MRSLVRNLKELRDELLNLKNAPLSHHDERCYVEPGAAEKIHAARRDFYAHVLNLLDEGHFIRAGALLEGYAHFDLARIAKAEVK